MIISKQALPRERPGEHGQQGGLCVRMDKTAQGSHTPNSSGPRDADRLRHAEDEGAHRSLRAPAATYRVLQCQMVVDHKSNSGSYVLCNTPDA